MGELLHAGALAAAAVGACCTAVDRPRARVRELTLGLLMVVSMSDIVWGWGLLAPMWWAALLLGAALVTGLRARGREGKNMMSALDAVGGILMAGLVLVMSAHPQTGGGHGGALHSGLLLVGVLTAASVVYAAVCVGCAVGMRGTQRVAVSRLQRVPPLAMGSSTLLMAGAVALA